MKTTKILALTEAAITGNQALVEEILSSQSGEEMTADEFYAWLDQA